MDLKDLELELIAEGDLIIKTLQQGSWEENSIITWVDECKKNKNGLILDLGSYNGIYAILAGLYSNNKIIAFEALKRNADKTAANIKLNKLSDRIDVYNLAVGDSNIDNGILYTNKGLKYPTASTLVKSTAKKNYIDTQDIQIRRLDSLISTRVTLMKIDIENSEVSALKGAIQILKKDTPTLLISLFNKDYMKEAFTFLKQLGYKSFNQIIETGIGKNYIVK